MTQESKRKLIKSLSMGLLYLFLVLVVGAFSVNIVVNGQMYSQDTHRMAENLMLDVREQLNQSASQFMTDFEKYTKICKESDNLEGFTDLTEQLKTCAEEDGFLGFTLKTINGDKNTALNKFYESYNDEYIEYAIANQKPTYYVYWNKAAISMCVSYYYPLRSGNGINLVSGIKTLDSIINTPQLNDLLDTYGASLYIADNGANPSNGHMKTDGKEVSNLLGDVFIQFEEQYTEKEYSSLTELKKTGRGTVDLRDSGTDWLMTKSEFGECNSSDLYLKINRDSLLFESENGLGGVIFSLVVLLITFIAVFAVLLIKWLSAERERNKRENKITLLNCSSYVKFSADAEEFILNNRNVYYAIVNLSITNMKYITERFGEAIGEHFKRYCSDVISSVIGVGETYGALQNDTFVMLVRYDLKAECVSKIALIREIINKYDFFKESQVTAQFCIGVYYINPVERVQIERFVEKANIAMLANKQNPGKTYSEYNNEIHEEFKIQDKIESKMEGALKNEDFYVFFQPKYNVAKDAIDGAETLVRWYDRKRDGFISPARFVQLFEANGFISKLDKYVFVKACEFLDSAVKSGLRVTPISVNVSRVTAIRRDFISFYKETKEKYNIPDNYITIEFTESFSFTNMEVLHKIVDDLHECGFLCSIDDFGSGYSSTGILKNLPMDELKLDMFLLAPSDDAEKSRILIEMMIRLGKAFGMKVTQEGVETAEQYNQLVELGCDVIQGYLYSKPLIASDFLDFINGPTSMRAAKEKSSKNVYKPINYIDFSQDKDDL